MLSMLGYVTSQRLTLAGCCGDSPP